MPDGSTQPAPGTPPAWASALERGISPDRLSKYRRSVPSGASLGATLHLYHWNILVSAALWEVLAYTEVILRNALDTQLQAWHQTRHGHGDWWDDPGRVLDDALIDDIDAARSRVHRTPATHGRVVAELNFGTWRYLLAGRYEHTLWTPALRLAFPNLRPARRGDIYTPVDRVNNLRNRIAHHEPIHAYDLDARHEDAIFIISQIDTDAAQRVRDTSRVATILKAKP